jgi:hypothetical protein
MTPSEHTTSGSSRRIWLLAAAVPVIAFVLLAVSFVSTMGHKAERLAGSNSVKLQQPVIQVDPHSLLCQGILAPKDAASVLLFAAPTAPKGPPLSMSLTARDGTRLASGHMAGGWTGGVARFSFARLAATHADAALCIRNQGAAPIAFGGLPAKTSTTVDGQLQDGTITVQFFRPGTSSWWSLLPTIAHRAGVLKGSLAGAWSFWFAAALLLLAGAGSIALVARSGRE